MFEPKPLPEPGLNLENSVDVFHDWLGFSQEHGLERPEFLFPILRRPVQPTEFDFLSRPIRLDAGTVRDRISALGPWDYTLNLNGVETRALDEVTRPEWRFHRYRVDLINASLARIFGQDLGGFNVLDIACHCGVFSLDLASRGAARVQGIDLRPENIEQARFLQQLYDVRNCDFQVGDAERLPDRNYDIILNLGLLYHVTFPMQLLQYCHDHSDVCCVIDTNVYNSLFAGFYLVAGKDIAQSCEGKSHAEFLPTYRGLALAMKSVGFTHVYELLGDDQEAQEIASFSDYYRRVLIAFKHAPSGLEAVFGGGPRG